MTLNTWFNQNYRATIAKVTEEKLEELAATFDEGMLQPSRFIDSAQHSFLADVI